MELIYKNPELRSIVYKLLLLLVVFLIITLLFVTNELNIVKRSIIDQNYALAGKLIMEYPNLEGDIIKFFTHEVSQNEISNGKSILTKYGYTYNIALYTHPIIKEIYSRLNWKVVFLLLLYFIPLFFIVKNEYVKIYKKIAIISATAEKVVQGDFGMVLSEQDEGQFSILSHQFNQMSNRLKLSLESLRQDKIFLKNIISDISHQLKTPLSSLIVLNELLIEDKDMTEQVRYDFLLKSKAQLDRMEWLIINLLKMARLEAGAIDFQMKQVQLIEPVQIALEALHIKAKQKCIDIKITEDHDNIYFNGDKDWTGEALTNIIKNCIEHTNCNGKIHIHLSDSPLFSRITVKDNGEGIHEKDILHIFERFYRGDSSVKTESIGIGLALSRLIIESQAGDLKVKSKKDVGIEFTITFLKGII